MVLISSEDSPFATLARVQAVPQSIDLKPVLEYLGRRKVRVVHAAQACSGKSSTINRIAPVRGIIPIYVGMATDVLVRLAHASVLSETLHFDFQHPSVIAGAGRTSSSMLTSWNSAAQRYFGTADRQYIRDPLTSLFEFIILGGVVDHLGRVATAYASTFFIEVGLASSLQTEASAAVSLLPAFLQLFNVEKVDDAKQALETRLRDLESIPNADTLKVSLLRAASKGQAFATASIALAAAKLLRGSVGSALDPRKKVSEALPIAERFLDGFSRSWIEASAIPQLMLGSLVSDRVSVLCNSDQPLSAGSLKVLNLAPRLAKLKLSQLAGFAVGNPSLGDGGTPSFSVTRSVVVKMNLLHSCIVAQVPLVLVYVISVASNSTSIGPPMFNLCFVVVFCF
jgi:hypothetical protein